MSDTRDLELAIQAAFPFVMDKPVKLKQIVSSEVEFLFDRHNFLRNYIDIAPEEYSENADSVFAIVPEELPMFLGGFLLASLRVNHRKSDVPEFMLQAFRNGRPSDQASRLSHQQRNVLQAVMIYCEQKLREGLSDGEVQKE